MSQKAGKAHEISAQMSQKTGKADEIYARMSQKAGKVDEISAAISQKADKTERYQWRRVRATSVATVRAPAAAGPALPAVKTEECICVVFIC
jgi:hypothetical protein